MEIFGTLLIGLLVLQLATALPTNNPADFDQEKLVREKRKSETTSTAEKDETSLSKPNALPSLPPADEASVDPSTENKEDEKTLNEDDEINPENAAVPEDGQDAGRTKKQACGKVLCDLKPCGGQEPPRMNHPELVYIKHEDPALLSVAGKPPKGARTIEPIYSFGPVSVNGAAGYGSNHHEGFANNAYGGSSYSYALKPSVSSQAYAPGVQLHAVIPYTTVHHRHPVVHHSVSYSQAKPDVVYAEAKPEVVYAEAKPEVVYYEAPEPVYVEAGDSYQVGHHQEATHHIPPVSLYCQKIKQKDHAKAMVSGDTKANTVISSDEKANTTKDEGELHEHIKRVNEIKEEIAQLNQAAQRIIDQQERNARMQQDQISAVSAKSAIPIMMRHHESQMRMPPYSMGYMPYMHPYFREADERSQPAMQQPLYYEKPAPADQSASKASPSNNEPAAPRSETGFPTSPLFSRASGNAANFPSTPEDTELFKKIVDLAKRMGMMRSDSQQSLQGPAEEKKEDDEPKSEYLLADLANGGRKESTFETPSKINVLNQEKSASSSAKKQDKRGLIHSI